MPRQHSFGRTATLALLILLATPWLAAADTVPADDTVPAGDFEVPVTAPDVTRLIADLAPETSPESSVPRPVALHRGELYFVADTTLHGRELWRTDGSADGTRLVVDLCPGPCDALGYIDRGVEFVGDKVLFFGDAGEGSVGLWSSDGTAEGTQRLTPEPSVATDPYGNHPAPRFAGPTDDGRVAFLFAADQNDQQIWRTDGTAMGTQILLDPAFGEGPIYASTAGDLVIYSRHHPDFGYVLWSIDIDGGTPAPLWTDCDGGGTCPQLTLEPVRAGNLVFFVTAEDAAGHGTFYEVWSTQGTPETTGQLTDLCPDGPFCCEYIRTLDPLDDGTIAFGTGQGIWTSDGTQAGTLLAGTLPDEARPFRFALSDGGLIALAGDVGATSTLWSLPQGGPPLQLQRIPSSFVEDLASTAGGVVFAGDDDADIDTSDLEPWVTDGTVGGTRRLRDVREGPDGSSPREILSDGIRAYFAATSDTTGRELWTTDGTSPGTEIVQDLEGRRGDSTPRDLVRVGEKVFFVADQADLEIPVDPVPPELAVNLGGSMMATDGFQVETLLYGRDADTVHAVEDRVFFTAFLLAGDEELGTEPFVTDGSPFGAVSLGDLFPGPGDSRAREPVALGDQILFFAENGTAGQKLWRSDGTAEGTELVTDIEPDWINIYEGCGVCSPPIDPGPIYPRHMRRLGDQAFFVARRDEEGAELWVSDGTVQGTEPLLDIAPGPGSSGPDHLTVVGDLLFFTAADSPGEPLDLWVTDGTAAGTTELVETIAPPGNFDLRRASRRAVETAVLENGDGPRLALLELLPYPILDSFEPLALGLWTSDGTALGTERIAELDHRAEQLHALGDVLVFRVDDPDLGSELWRKAPGSDPEPIVDLVPGPRGSAPEILAGDGTYLTFAATTPQGRRELYSTNGFRWSRISRLAPGLENTEHGSGSSYDILDRFREELDRDASAALLGNQVVFSGASDEVGIELFATPVDGAPLCNDTQASHCLNGRFQISADFVDADGLEKPAQTLGGTDDTGYFWFFGEDNVELAVKVLDGTAINGTYWLYYGALSDVEYRIVAEDLYTGIRRTYENEPGNLCGLGDVGAFPDLVFAQGGPDQSPSPRAHPIAREATRCDGAPSATTLCLLDRFEVEVTWRTDAEEGQGSAVPFSDETGLFWFFGEDNIELAVKVLDGTPINDRYWVYYGALSDVEYTITVRDSVTGEEKRYENPAGNLCGGADVAAF